MTERVGDWVALVDACYPEGDAEGWDAVGLHVGAPEDAVDGVLVTLDVTPAVVVEAVAASATSWSRTTRCSSARWRG